MFAVSPLPSGGTLPIRRQLPFPSNLESLILAIGSDRLSALLFDLMRAEFAIEHTVIARRRRNGPIEVLFAKNAHDSAMTGELCSRYTSHYYLRDPVLGRLGPAQRRELLVCSLALRDIEDAGYRSRFFLEPDFAGKVAIISRTPDQLLYLNFYRRREDGAFRESDLWRLQVCGPLIAAIAERHFSLDVPASCSLDLLMGVFRRSGPAARLSEREVQTCARIAIGYSTERIARELKISKNSVVTFRRRAFAKLNIATHKELFAFVLSNRHRMD